MIIDFFPSKHVRLDESLLGVSAAVIAVLDQPEPLDSCVAKVRHWVSGRGAKTSHLHASNICSALLFLYAIGALEVTSAGEIMLCGS